MQRTSLKQDITHHYPKKAMQLRKSFFFSIRPRLRAQLNPTSRGRCRGGDEGGSVEFNYEGKGGCKKLSVVLRPITEGRNGVQGSIIVFFLQRERELEAILSLP